MRLVATLFFALFAGFAMGQSGTRSAIPSSPIISGGSQLGSGTRTVFPQSAPSVGSGTRTVFPQSAPSVGSGSRTFIPSSPAPMISGGVVTSQSPIVSSGSIYSGNVYGGGVISQPSFQSSPIIQQSPVIYSSQYPPVTTTYRYSVPQYYSQPQIRYYTPRYYQSCR